MNKAVAEPTRLLTVKQVCEASGISQREIRRKVAHGALPAISFGDRLIRIRLDDYEQFIRKGGK